MYTAILLSLHVQYVKKRKTRLITREIRRIFKNSSKNRRSPAKANNRIAVGIGSVAAVPACIRRQKQADRTGGSENVSRESEGAIRIPGIPSISERVEV